MRLLLLMLLSGLFACGKPPEPTDAGTDGGSGTDAGLDAGTDAGQPDAGPLADFPLRAPQRHALTCGGQTSSFQDTDWYCRVPIGAGSIELYVQATPTSCVALGLSATPVFGDVRAWYKVGGQGQALPTTARYLWGGNHHNDELHFTFEGGTYAVWHSSIGVGFRVCAPFDCLITCPAGTSVELCDALTPNITNGCARQPGGPPPPSRVWCAPVEASGTLPTLSDPWTSMPARLPCFGE